MGRCYQWCRTRGIRHCARKRVNRPRKPGPGCPRELVCPPAVQKAMPDADESDVGQRSVSRSVEPAVHDIHVGIDPVLGHIPRINLVTARSQGPLFDHRRIEFHLARGSCDGGIAGLQRPGIGDVNACVAADARKQDASSQSSLSRLTFSRRSARACSSTGVMSWAACTDSGVQ